MDFQADGRNHADMPGVARSRHVGRGCLVRRRTHRAGSSRIVLSVFSCHGEPVESRHLSRIIRTSPRAVYHFASKPNSLPKWASGLAKAEVVRDGDTVLVESPMGRVAVRFAPMNEFGVLDHDVTLPTGATETNPMRVLAHPDGSEVIFTIRQSELDDEEFERDTKMVEVDLDRLKQLMEARP